MNYQTKTESLSVCGYEFEGPYTEIGRLRDAAGVYGILDWRSDDKWHFIDVGESEQVKTRVGSHDRRPCWERHRQGTLGVAVLYTAGWTPQQRRALEAKIREEYNPPCGQR